MLGSFWRFLDIKEFMRGNLYHMSDVEYLYSIIYYHYYDNTIELSDKYTKNHPILILLVILKILAGI